MRHAAGSPGSAAGGPEPCHFRFTGRSLLLVAGLPGAGKSTLLAALPVQLGVVVLDSDAQRAALRRVLPGWLAYAHYRWLVHLMHRTAAVLAILSRTPVVVVHLPATKTGVRTVVARLCAVTGRSAHLLWLDVDPAAARSGQSTRGRVIPPASFAGHARRAEGLAARWRAGEVPRGWASVTVLDRAAARGGLRISVTPARGPAPDGPGAARRTGFGAVPDLQVPPPAHEPSRPR